MGNDETTEYKQQVAGAAIAPGFAGWTRFLGTLGGTAFGAGLFLALGSRASGTAAWIAHRFAEMGIESGALLGSGVICAGLAVLAHQIGRVNQRLRTAEESMLYTEALSQSMRRLVEQFTSLHANLSQLRDGQAAGLHMLRDQARNQTNGMHVDATYHLAASMDQLGRQVEERFSEHQAVVASQLDDLTLSVTESREEVSNLLEETRVYQRHELYDITPSGLDPESQPILEDEKLLDEAELLEVCVELEEPEPDELRREQEAWLKQELRQQNDAKLLEELQRMEELRLQKEFRQQQQARHLEELRLEEEARVQEQIRLAETARVQEEMRLAEATRVREQLRRQSEAERLEELRLKEEAESREELRLKEAAKTTAELKAKEQQQKTPIDPLAFDWDEVEIPKEHRQSALESMAEAQEPETLPAPLPSDGTAELEWEETPTDLSSEGLGLLDELGDDGRPHAAPVAEPSALDDVPAIAPKVVRPLEHLNELETHIKQDLDQAWSSLREGEED